MKKIGMITIHDTTNFGSWLQTYALYRTVKKMKYYIEIIDYKCEGIYKREKLTKEKLSYMSIEDIINQIKKQIVFKAYTIIYLKLSKKCNHKNIGKLCKKYNIVLLGSDLVWDFNITYNDTTYLLDFLDNATSRCAYAASSGRTYIPDTQRETFKKNLKNFNYISVREDSMVSDINSLSGKEIKHVCDPTMLLKNSEWKKFVKKRPIKEKYVLIYFVDGKGNLSRLAQKYAKENNLKVLAINKDYNIKNKDIINVFSIKQFLTYVYYSEKIFTSSYHGMMFSLIFNKQFVFYPFAPGTRMQSVCDMYKLSAQNIISRDFDVNSEINYKEVNMKMSDFRKSSISQLRSMLEDLL